MPTSDQQRNEKPKGFEMQTDAVSGNAFDLPLLRRLFRYARPHPHLLAGAVAFTILGATLAPLRPYLTKVAIDDHIAIGDKVGLFYVSLAFLAVVTLEAMAQFGASYLTQLLGQKAVMRLRLDIFEHLQKLALKFFDRNPIGRLITRTTNDVETLNEMLSSGLVALLGDTFLLSFIVAMMLYTDWRLTLVTFAVLPAMVWVSIEFKKKARLAYQDIRTEVARLNAFLQERITGVATIQLFGRERKEFEKHSDINAAHRDANIRSVFYYSLFYPAIELLSSIALGLVIWHSATRMLDADLTLGVVVAFAQYVGIFFRPIQDLSDKYNIMQTAITSAERIFRLLDERVFISEPKEPKTLVNPRGDIVFDRVWFAYNDEHWVLQDVSFSAKAGERVAIVGATGSGKSTTVALLSKFYEPQRGRIAIDGIDLRDLSEQDVRRHVGVVLQDVFLFSGTIRDNIALGNPAITDAQIKEAAELVGAAAFIEKLPNGYDYEVQERGSALSTGQRQLIAFARAVVYDPKILALDEATSSVDAETEELIEAALEKLMKGRTCIIIAHRLSTIQHCDKILVMHKGILREQGAHQELLAQRGLYYKLYQLQCASRRYERSA
ncbi:MAG: ABC transporter ATP-binding protein/permease [Chloroherpetonaceae bacterium]|nr:ABC transporter ATP-binding protein/permease [Chloroherpetonaceae bacterium]MDW8437339.1 ABC transporter ATP-binding protein [Chloroherpetonaceae bacterium]